MGAWLQAFPENGVELPVEPHVLAVLGGTNQSLDAAKDLEFVSSSRRVAVSVVSSFEGYRQRQVWLRPVQALSIGRWTLQVKKGVTPSIDRPLGSWRVGAASSTVEPAFGTKPTVAEVQYAELGCGPASTVTIKVDGSASFVEARTTLKGEATTGVFPVEAGLVKLGHGMCSGGFSFEPKSSVRVELTPLDTAGRRGSSSATVELTAPGP